MLPEDAVTRAARAVAAALAAISGKRGASPLAKGRVDEGDVERLARLRREDAAVRAGGGRASARRGATPSRAAIHSTTSRRRAGAASLPWWTAPGRRARAPRREGDGILEVAEVHPALVARPEREGAGADALRRPGAPRAVEAGEPHDAGAEPAPARRPETSRSASTSTAAVALDGAGGVVLVDVRPVALAEDAGRSRVDERARAAPTGRGEERAGRVDVGGAVGGLAVRGRGLAGDDGVRGRQPSPRLRARRDRARAARPRAPRAPPPAPGRAGCRSRARRERRGAARSPSRASRIPPRARAWGPHYVGPGRRAPASSGRALGAKAGGRMAARDLTLTRTVTLPGGVEMPVLGLGVWQAGAGEETQRRRRGGARASDTATSTPRAPTATRRDVGAAIARERRRARRGLRHDEALERRPRLRPGAPRHATRASCGSASSRWTSTSSTGPSRGSASETWRAMERILADGKARAIGVSQLHRPPPRRAARPREGAARREPGRAQPVPPAARAPRRLPRGTASRSRPTRRSCAPGAWTTRCSCGSPGSTGARRRRCSCAGRSSTVSS